MRTLLSHTVRPRIGHGINKSTLVPRAPRKSISASGCRKLSFNDAFTILLAPVLGTALIADTTWKDKKKDDWTRKLAIVQDEIEALRERELQAWSNLQLRSAQHGARHHHRSYSTAARAYANDAESELEAPEDGNDEANLHALSATSPSTTEIADWKRYENLVASKLAIEMILHIRSGKSVLHRLPTEVVLDKMAYPESLDELVQQLVRINANLKVFASSKSSEAVPRSVVETEERAQLHQHIISMCRSCRRGQIPVRDLVHGYAQAVAKAKAAPSIATYNAMLEALSAQDSDSLAYTVMGAMRTSKQYLSDRAIWAMLWQYGKYKDLGRLDEFLWLLTKENSGLKLRSRWQQVFVNGVRVPVPHDRNPDLLSILVRVALQCGLIHKAEAWATLLFQQGQRCKKYAFVFRSMIQHCAENGDWKAGQQWVEKAIMWASVLSEEAPEALSRIIFNMLDLCVTCDQPGEYEKILQATARSGVQLNMIDKEKPAHFSDRALSIRDDWERQVEQQLKAKQQLPEENLSERARQFQNILAIEDADLKPFIGVTDAKEVLKLAAQRKDPASTVDSSGTLSSPEEIISDIGLSPSNAVNKNVRQLRRSLKELLKHSEDQKARIRRLMSELNASRAEIARLTAANSGIDIAQQLEKSPEHQKQTKMTMITTTTKITSINNRSQSPIDAPASDPSIDDPNPPSQPRTAKTTITPKLTTTQTNRSPQADVEPTIRASPPSSSSTPAKTKAKMNSNTASRSTIYASGRSGGGPASTSASVSVSYNSATLSAMRTATL